MARKRQSHLDAPPAASSSEEVESSEEDSGSGSDSELESTTLVNPHSSATKPAPASSSSSSGETETDSESESEMKPIARAGVKRPAAAEEEEEEEESNPKKKKSESGEGSSSRMVWSEEEEVAILKGMALYRAKKGVDPQADMNGFYGFIKKSVEADFSKSQFLVKVRGLKKKYTAKVDENKSYSAHEMNMFELAKSAWGLKEEPKSNATPSNTNTNEGEKGEEEAVIKRMTEESMTEAEFHKKWQKIQIAEMDLFLKKGAVLKEQYNVIRQGLESSMWSSKPLSPQTIRNVVRYNHGPCFV